MIIDSARPLRVVFGWQAAATALLAVLSGWLAGVDGAVSAVLGGGVALAGGVSFALLLPGASNRSPSVWGALRGALRAEAVKVGVIVLLLWLVLTTYRQVVVLGFIGTFTVAVIIFSMAALVRSSVTLETGKNNVN